MHISIQSNTGISVSQQFTQRLCIKPMGNTICSISVPKQMKWDLPDTTKFQDFLKPILHGSRFCRFAFPSNQVQKILSLFLFQQCQQEGRNRNCPHRSSAFWGANQYLRAAISIDSLHRSFYRKCSVFKVNIAPLQATQFTYTQTGEQAQQNRQINGQPCLKKILLQLLSLLRRQNIQLLFLCFWHSEMRSMNVILLHCILFYAVVNPHNVLYKPSGKSASSAQSTALQFLKDKIIQLMCCHIRKILCSEIRKNMIANDVFIVCITGRFHTQFCCRKPLTRCLCHGQFQSRNWLALQNSLKLCHFFLYFRKRSGIHKFVFQRSIFLMPDWDTSLKPTVFSLVNVAASSWHWKSLLTSFRTVQSKKTSAFSPILMIYS